VFEQRHFLRLHNAVNSGRTCIYFGKIFKNDVLRPLQTNVFLKNVVNLGKLITYIKIRYTFKLNTRYNTAFMQLTSTHKNQVKFAL
jgi:hypothetical protein